MKEKATEQSFISIDELKSSLEFVKDLTIFAAFIFAFLFNILYLALEKDYQIKKAYLKLAHYELYSEEELVSAVKILNQNVKKSATTFSLCETDFELIELAQKFKGELKKMLHQLLQEKFKKEGNWKKIWVENFPSSDSPFYVPNIEMTILYCAWFIEIFALVFLSQTIQKEHFRLYIYHCIQKANFFIPIMFVLLFLPIWKLVLLSFIEMKIWILFFFTFPCIFFFSLLLYFLVRNTITEKHINELGLYILSSSLFIQFLGIIADIDTVYARFGSSSMPYILYASWFILICIPLLLLEKIFKKRKEKRKARKIVILS